LNDKDLSVTGLHAKIDTLSEAHANLRDDMRRHADDESDVMNMIRGNGEPGLFERVRNVERFASQATWLIKIQVAAMVVGAGTLVFDMVRSFMSRGG
jgi:hypothetical protein